MNAAESHRSLHTIEKCIYLDMKLHKAKNKFHAQAHERKCT